MLNVDNATKSDILKNNVTKSDILTKQDKQSTLSLVAIELAHTLVD